MRPKARTLAEYAERWLKLCASLKPGTQEGYEQKLRKHILPSLGQCRLKDLTRGHVRTLLAEKLQGGLARDTVRLIHATLRALLAAAVEDELLKANPASGVGRSLRLAASKVERSEMVKAMTREQLEAFLEQALHVVPDFQILFWLMSRTGLRLSEALALKWQDVDVMNRRLRVERALGRDLAVTTPKSGHGRSVDLSVSASDELMALGKLRCSMGYKTGPHDWLFPSSDGRPLSHEAPQAAFRKTRAAAGLLGFTPHSLRHTYASILLAEGVSPAYVQEQLGHSSIELTVGTYGRWLRKKAPGALDVLEKTDETRP